jgi:peptidoglycan lytic transglycosylase D
VTRSRLLQYLVKRLPQSFTSTDFRPSMEEANARLRMLVPSALLVLGLLCGLGPGAVEAAGPRKKAAQECSRYSIPEGILAKPFRFAGSEIPLRRRDVKLRIRFQLNFLLLDARSVLTEWLIRKERYSWIFEDIFTKENIPKDFILLAPVLSGLDVRYSSKNVGAGCWALDKPCGRAEGIEMSNDSWRDDRLDLELSTKCFAVRIKKLRKKIPGNEWIMAAAAYVSSSADIEKRIESWKTNIFWDLPLPANAEDLVCRWIALGIIESNPRAFGLDVSRTPPLTFDQISGLVLSKDLPVSQMAKGAGVDSLTILRLNPKIKIAKGMLPAKKKRKRISHSLAVPRGKGWNLVNYLKKKGYLAQTAKR